MKLAMAGEASKEFSMDELIAKGEGVYQTACAGCHQLNGQGIPGAFPAITGSAIATGAIDAHIDIVVNGKTGTAMQAFKEQLSAVDIAAVVTYQRNALGNSVGDLVQPSAVQK
jgi:cytochrome c oxidase subunit 2